MIKLINEWKDKIAEYLDVKVKLVKLNLIESVARIFGFFIFIMIGSLLGFAILIYLGLAMAEWFTLIAEGSRIAGFLMTVGFYMFLCVVLYLLRNPIIKMLTGKIIKIITESTEDEEK